MPSLIGPFDKEKYESFISEKQKMWSEYGYGPWGLTLDGVFIGWGGLQPVDSDVEIALVLHPKYWGIGKQLYYKFIKYAFEEKKLKSVIILFPPSRTKIKAIFKLGFVIDGEYEYLGEKYIRYRLYAPQN